MTGRKVLKEVDLLVAVMEEKEIEEKMGCLSSLDEPDYEKLEIKQDTIRMRIKELSQKVPGIPEHEFYKLYQDMAKDLHNVYHISSKEIIPLIEKEQIRFQPMNLEEFLEKYVGTRESQPLFFDLFWFSDVRTRVDFLMEHYLCNTDIYFSTFLDYLVLLEVDEAYSN